MNESMFDLLTLDGTNGFILRGATNFRAFSGDEVQDAGDINSDGFDDILIGANSYSIISATLRTVFKAPPESIDFSLKHNG